MFRIRSRTRRGDVKKTRKTHSYPLCVALVIFASVTLYYVTAPVIRRYQSSRLVPKDSSMILTTGYCSCGKCCGWNRSFFGFGPPVYSYGKNKGKRKKVGMTASGTMAKIGTIAADPKVFPFGTKLKVPGYGMGTVEDIGGAIKGMHIDLWFPTHAAAKKWGARWVKVERIK